MYDKATISGHISVGKTTLFLALEKTLGWPTFSASQFFRDRAKTTHVSLQKAEEQNVDVTTEVDLHMQGMLKNPGHILLEGWMAGIMADSIPGVLKILLTCDAEVCAQRLALREKISLDDARHNIREREESWKEKLEKIYHRTDFWNAQNYDLIIDTTARTPQEVLDVALKALR